MTNKKSAVIPEGQSNLFDIFSVNANQSTVEVKAPPPQPQIQEEPAQIKKSARPVLPDGWAVEDIRFLLGILESAPILVADTNLGIPTIHDDFGAEVQHCGFGVMKVAGPGYELIFDAGGAMERTPSGKGWTRLDIRNGKYPYDSKAVREKLEAYLPKDDPSQVADLFPALPVEPGLARGPRLAERPTEEMAKLAKEVYELYQHVGHNKSDREAEEELATKLGALNEIEKDLVNLMDEERRAGVKRPDLIDKTRAIDREVKDSFWDFHKYVVPFLNDLMGDTKGNPQGLENISRPADDDARSEQSDPQPEDELVTLAKEAKEMMEQLDMSGSADLSTLNVFRQKAWSITHGINELEDQIVNNVGEERKKAKDTLANMEAILGDLTVNGEWMRSILLKLLLPENLRHLIKVEVSGPDTLMFFGNGYGLKLELQLTAAGELTLETVKAAVIQALDGVGYTHYKDAPVKDCATTVNKLPEICEQLMKLTLPKTLVEEQAKEFDHDLGYFTGTEKWTRYQGLCPHILLLTDGALYVAEHGGEDGNSAYWLIDAIASYQGEDALKRHTFQVWNLCVLPPDPEDDPEKPDVPAMSVGAVLKSKQGDSPAQPRNPCRHAVLTCTNGNKKELVRQEIDYTDFLPVGKLTLYASVENQPDVSTTRKVMIILLPSED